MKETGSRGEGKQRFWQSLQSTEEGWDMKIYNQRRKSRPGHFLRPAVIAVVNSEEDVVAECQVRSVSVVRFTWLDQTDDHLVYTIGEASNSNSPKCIFGTVTNYTCDRARTGCSFTLTPEEENRLCRLADRQDIRNDNSNYIHHDRQVWRGGEWRRQTHSSVCPSKSGRGLPLQAVDCEIYPPQFWTRSRTGKGIWLWHLPLKCIRNIFFV